MIDDLDFKAEFENFDAFKDMEFEPMKTKYREVDICGLVLKMKSKKRSMFNVTREVRQLGALIKEGAVVLIGLNHKVLAVSGARRVTKVLRDTAH